MFAVPAGVADLFDYVGSALLRAAAAAIEPVGHPITSLLGDDLALVGAPPAAYHNGVTVRLMSIQRFAPSEYAHGPLHERVAAAFVLEVRNGSAEVLNLASGTTSAASGTPLRAATRLIDLPRYDPTLGV